MPAWLITDDPIYSTPFLFLYTRCLLNRRRLYL